jgi:hypothetical protein
MRYGFMIRLPCWPASGLSNIKLARTLEYFDAGAGAVLPGPALFKTRK